MGMHVFIGTIVHSLDSERMEILRDTALAVDSNGKILFLKPANEYEHESGTGSQLTKLSDRQFLFPGFIDTHAHAPQYPNCGIFGDSTLLEWLDKYTFPMESKFDDVELATIVYSRLIERQLSCGTTTTSYYGTVHVNATVKLAELCLTKGLRALVGRVCMQRFCPEALQMSSLESDIEFLEAMQKLDPSHSRVKPVITPRFAPSCDFNVLSNLGDLARQRNLPIQTHINENLKEIEWVKELFPGAKSYTDVYDRAKLLKNDTVLAHGVHFSEEELETIKERESGISHCPNSNASIASGIARIKDYLKKGIKVSLGSDVSGGATPSILKNARLSLLMSRLLSQREDNSPDPILSTENAVFMATLGGAEVLNLDKIVGNFKVGKQFDAQLIDVTAQGSLIDVFDFALSSDELERITDLLNKWIYIGDDRNTLKVWIGGKLVYSRF